MSEADMESELLAKGWVRKNIIDIMKDIAIKYLFFLKWEFAEVFKISSFSNINLLPVV